MTEQRLEPGAAASLALNTLSAQINALINCSTGAAKMQAESLLTLLNSNMTMILEAANDQVDEMNNLIDQLEKSDAELNAAQQEATRVTLELKKLRAGRLDDEQKVKAIFSEVEQIKLQRDNFKRDAEGAGQLRAELSRLKKQADRHAEAQAKKDAELNAANQTIQRLRSRLAPTTDAVRGVLDTLRFTRQAMIFEGLATEQTIEHNGEQFHIYRQPGNVASGFTPMDTDKSVSREHQYYFRVETNAGYHYDVLPMEGGDIAVSKHKALPAAVKKHLIAMFTQETLFNWEKVTMRSDAMSQRLAEIEALITPTESILMSFDKQLITNQVITNSTVNRNKNKRRAA